MLRKPFPQRSALTRLRGLKQFAPNGDTVSSLERVPTFAKKRRAALACNREQFQLHSVPTRLPRPGTGGLLKRTWYASEARACLNRWPAEG
jgi:hypothetical protein